MSASPGIEFSGKSRAGFVLAGGRSSRMGLDKALLKLGPVSDTLIEQIAGRVKRAAGNVTLIAPPHRYAHLGIPTVADQVKGCGPLGGLFTALNLTEADWNLIVACDLPHATAALFAELFEAAEHAGCIAVVPSTGSGIEPLCAVYHRSAKSAAASAVFDKRLKMQEFVSTLQARIWPVHDAGLFRNINTPEDWRQETEAGSP